MNCTTKIKKEYQSPEAEISIFKTKDILTVSGNWTEFISLYQEIEEVHGI